MATAGTFPVLQEQVRIGTTTGVAGAQAVDGLRETLTEADVASNVTTPPSAQNVTLGSAVAGTFPADVATADGAYAQYREATPGPVTVVGNPATTLPGCTWTACDSGRLSDNVSASSSAGGAVANYSAFALSVPVSAVILAVGLGYEAFDPAGNDHLSMTISWDGGTTWCPAFVTGGLPAADPNAYTFVNVTACSGHIWSPADFGANLTVRFTHVVVGGADTIDLDANAVRVTYRPLAYQLDVRYTWSGVPSGPPYALGLRGHISNDSVSVEVLTPPSSWTPRLTINAATDANLSYTLAPSEFVSGNVSIRFVDALGSSPTPSDLWIDLAEVVGVAHAFRLDVVQNVTGIAGADPTLRVVGNISAGGGNFDVLVWDFVASAWTVALSAPFTAAYAAYVVPLTAGEISSGTVRVDFRDHGAASSVPASLTLDFVGVQAIDPAAAFPWIPILGGVAAGVPILAMAWFMFILPRRRRSERAVSKEASPERAEASASVAAEETAAEVAAQPPPMEAVSAELAPVVLTSTEERAEVPTVDVKALESGHAYLLDGEEPAAALPVLEELTRMGRSGLVITRRPLAELEGLARLRHTTSLVLGDGPGALFGLVTDANRYVLVSAIEAFLRKNPVGVVLLDGLGDLAGRDGMSAVLALVQETAVNVASGQQILLASAVPQTLEEEQERRLRGLLEFVHVSVPPRASLASA